MTVPTVEIKSVLVMSEFSPASDESIRLALAIARHYGSRLYFAHVAAADGYSIGCAGAVRRAVDTARRDADQLSRELEQSGATSSVPHEFIVREGDTWEQLDQIIREKQVDLLVISEDSSRTPGACLLSSRAEQNFRRIDRSFLTVGPGAGLDEPAQQDSGLNTLLFATAR